MFHQDAAGNEREARSWALNPSDPFGRPNRAGFGPLFLFERTSRKFEFAGLYHREGTAARQARMDVESPAPHTRAYSEATGIVSRLSVWGRVKWQKSFVSTVWLWGQPALLHAVAVTAGRTDILLRFCAVGVLQQV